MEERQKRTTRGKPFTLFCLCRSSLIQTANWNDSCSAARCAFCTCLSLANRFQNEAWKKHLSEIWQGHRFFCIGYNFFLTYSCTPSATEMNLYDLRSSLANCVDKSCNLLPRHIEIDILDNLDVMKNSLLSNRLLVQCDSFSRSLEGRQRDVALLLGILCVSQYPHVAHINWQDIAECNTEQSQEVCTLHLFCTNFVYFSRHRINHKWKDVHQ